RYRGGCADRRQIYAVGQVLEGRILAGFPFREIHSIDDIRKFCRTKAAPFRETRRLFGRNERLKGPVVRERHEAAQLWRGSGLSLPQVLQKLPCILSGCKLADKDLRCVPSADNDNIEFYRCQRQERSGGKRNYRIHKEPKLG